MSEMRIIPGIAPPSMHARPAAGPGKPGDPAFLDALQKAISEASEAQKTADASTVELQSGKTGIHETLIAVEKAEISFRLLMQVRNKVLEAYKEVMRMNV